MLYQLSYGHHIYTVCMGTILIYPCQTVKKNMLSLSCVPCHTFHETPEYLSIVEWLSRGGSPAEYASSFSNIGGLDHHLAESARIELTTVLPATAFEADCSP